jgi:pyruvate dehydrogenase E2 component (dihydrolipoamide acetyltransferase)
MTSVSNLLSSLAAIPEYDFSEFGDVEIKPLSKIQRITGAVLGRNWVTIPHVTHHDELDFTAAEYWRKSWNAAHPELRITPVAMIAKAMAIALKDNLVFNTSLCADGLNYVQKLYFNVGVAVDTPKGLLVPVLRSLDERSVADAASDLSQLAEKAKTKGLSMAEMSGSSITLSSLGHIGGTAFTPIINAPDVATMGVLPLRDAPARDAFGGLIWRKALPVSLSYDHRVVNGADAARYLKSIEKVLQNPEAML